MASNLRQGYLRGDPRDLAGVFKAALEARDRIGTFDKPRYVVYSEACVPMPPRAR